MEKISLNGISIHLVGSSKMSSPEDCCVYLITDDQDFSMLVDAGAGSNHSILNICKNIAKIRQLDQIQYILVTHAHIDHVGGLKEIKSNFLSEAKIIAHKYAANVINTEDSVLSAANWYNTNLQSIDIDIHLTNNYEINLNGAKFLVLPTPGHTPGSIVGILIMQNSKKCALFGQDIHGPFRPEWKSDISEWKLSMQKILVYEPDYLCEGHFGIIEGKKKVKQFINGYLSQLK